MRKIISVGKRSSAIAAVIGLAYGILQILFGLQLISLPENLYWFFLPSLLLAPVFLITTVCLDFLVTGKSKIWTTIAWVLATINCTMIAMVYFSQFAIVNFSVFNWGKGDLGVLIFEHHTTLVAVEYTGYFLISTSTFISAFAFRNPNAKGLYRSLLINGLLLAILIVSWFYPHYYYLASVWVITFPLATLQATRFFKMEERKLQKEEKRITHAQEWVIQ